MEFTWGLSVTGLSKFSYVAEPKNSNICTMHRRIYRHMLLCPEILLDKGVRCRCCGTTMKTPYGYTFMHRKHVQIRERSEKAWMVNCMI